MLHPCIANEPFFNIRHFGVELHPQLLKLNCTELPNILRVTFSPGIAQLGVTLFSVNCACTPVAKRDANIETRIRVKLFIAIAD
jgi:hypothetical protein